jgi:hypothetical protein
VCGVCVLRTQKEPAIKTPRDKTRQVPSKITLQNHLVLCFSHAVCEHGLEKPGFTRQQDGRHVQTPKNI